ncbi:MAG: Cna B-type domain-containing protein [Clostridia bacterium]|nr:Cna B-type domain-containing protein [Clostridia bacterium]
MKKYISILLSIIGVFVIVLSGTLAWQSVGQTARNITIGSGEVLRTIWLEKKENTTGEPVSGAVFYLYKYEDPDDPNNNTLLPVDGIPYITGTDGSFSIEKLLTAGKYCFIEETPPTGYIWTVDNAGKRITEYAFTVKNGEEQQKYLINAYDLALPREDGSLLLHNLVKNADGSPLTEEQKTLPFQYHIHFSCEGEVQYTLYPAGTVDPDDYQDGRIETETIGQYVVDAIKGTVQDGDTLYLRHGEAVIFHDLPDGTEYYITQDPVPAYVTETITPQGIIEEDKAQAIFINIYDPEKLTGTLVIRKNAVEGAEDNAMFSFLACVGGEEEQFSLCSGGEYRITDIPLGSTYTVTETDSGGYTAEIQTYSGIVQTTDTVILDFYNTPAEDGDGNLTIRKEIPDMDNSEDIFRFAVTIGEQEARIITLKDGESKTFTAIPAGTQYTVQETEVSGPYAPVIGPVSGCMNGGEDREIIVTMENRQQDTVGLLINKKVVNAPALQEGEKETEFHFSLQLDRPGNMVSGDGTVPLYAVRTEGQKEISEKISLPVRLCSAGNNTWYSGVQDFTLTADDAVRFIIPYGVMYTVKETVPENYTVSYSGNIHGTAVQSEEVTVTNTYTDPGDEPIQERIDIPVEKEWVDDSNAEGKRPETITVQLLADGETVKTVEISGEAGADRWKYTFMGLDRYKTDAAGQKTEIAYTVQEIAVPGYTSSVDGFVLTNTRSPAGPEVPEEITIAVRKKWKDDLDAGQKRPEQVLVRLRNTVTDQYLETQYLQQANDWQHTFTITDPVFGADGKPAYLVEEVMDDTVRKYYDASVGELQYAGGSEYTCDIVNTYRDNTEQETETVTITVKKYWEYAEFDPDRPESITVHLYADGASVESQRLYLRSAGNTDDEWIYTFDNNGEGYPKRNADGTEIRYTVLESGVSEEYVISSTRITDGEKEILAEITNTYRYREICGEKIWYNGIHTNTTDKIYLHLYRYQGDTETYLNRIEVTEGEDGRWLYSTGGLPVFDDAGNRYEYKIYEQAPEGYGYFLDEDNTIYNVHETDERRYVTVYGTKYWVTGGTPEAAALVKPVIVGLYANGELADQQIVGERKTESGGTDWTYAFASLPRFDENGRVIVYTVQELAGADGFICSVSGGLDEELDYRYDLKNVYSPRIDISGVKTWDHRTNPRSQWPAEIQINLYQNGVWYAQNTVTADDGWAYTFADLPQFDEGGQSYTYTVREVAVEGYLSAVDGYDIHNTFDPIITVHGRKTWEHRGLPVSQQPQSIVVKLLADGKLIDWDRVWKWDNWEYFFDGLPKYDENGREIVYEIEEEPIEGYRLERDRYDLHNVYDPKITISGTKIWDHRNNPTGNQPVYADVYLYADGQLVDEKRVTVEDAWRYSFADCPVYAEDGHEIVYTVGEAPVDDYTVTIDGYDLSNTYDPRVTIRGAKTWIHRENPKENWPAYADVYLYANGETVAQTRISAENGWEYVFEDMPGYTEDGIPIVYTIQEGVTEGYTAAVEGYDLINRYDSRTEVSGAKIWEHRDNPPENQPVSIVVYLFADGDLYLQTEVTAETGWKYTFQNLPKYNADGTEIVYTVDERTAEGYAKTIDGYDLINVYDPKITISGNKTWIHGTNPLTEQPDSLTVYLLADGELLRQSVITAETDWSYTFRDLPKYAADGTVIRYTIDECSVEEYTKEIVGLNLINTYKGDPDGDTSGDLPDIPQTGDDVNLFPWILIFILSASGAGILLYILWKLSDPRRKRK